MLDISKNLINIMNPSVNKNLLDVACGTGDIGKLFLDNFTKNVNEITTISIRSFENNINLVKQNNSYISESSYPLKKGLWENLITSLSLLRIEGETLFLIIYKYILSLAEYLA